MQAITHFLNSKLGLALLGIFGTFALPTLWAIYQSHLQANQQLFESQLAERKAEEQQRLSHIHDESALISQPIVQRLAATEMLLQLEGRRSTKEEDALAWKSYQSAYRDYVVFSAGNSVPRDRVGENDAGFLNAHPVLWTYLQAIIDPELETVHECLSEAHETYNPDLSYLEKHSGPDLAKCMYLKITGHAPKNKSVSWDAPILVRDPTCIINAQGDYNSEGDTDGHQVKRLLHSCKLAKAEYADPWGLLKNCMGTFLIELETDFQFRDALARDGASEEASTTDLQKCPPLYEGDSYCRQMRFSRATFNDMEAGCGFLERGSLDVVRDWEFGGTSDK